MKKIIIFSLTAASLLLAEGNITKLTKEQLKQIKENTKIFVNKNINIKEGYDRGSFYQLITEYKTPRGPQIIPAYKVKESGMIFVGAAYTKDGKQIEKPINVEEIKNGVAFTYGKGDKEIYLFTDPECPYCQRLEKTYGENLKNNKVHVVLYPLSFHKHAKPMTQWILRGKTDQEKAERMNKVMTGDLTWQKDLNLDKDYDKAYQEYIKVLTGETKVSGKFFKDQKELDAFKAYLEKSKNASEGANVRGTPTLLDSKFKQINPATL